MPVVVFWRYKGFLKIMMCHSKTLISQQCTCLGYFHMEKSCLSGFGNYVAFALLQIPVEPSNSNSFTFHHSSFSVFLVFCFVFFPFLTLFPIWLLSKYPPRQKKNFFPVHPSQIFLMNAVVLSMCQDSRPAASDTQKLHSSQFFHSDDVNKASNTESVPPEWGPTPNIIVYASPFPS